MRQAGWFLAHSDTNIARPLEKNARSMTGKVVGVNFLKSFQDRLSLPRSVAWRKSPKRVRRGYKSSLQMVAHLGESSRRPSARNQQMCYRPCFVPKKTSLDRPQCWLRDPKQKFQEVSVTISWSGALSTDDKMTSAGPKATKQKWHRTLKRNWVLSLHVHHHSTWSRRE